MIPQPGEVWIADIPFTSGLASKLRPVLVLGGGRVPDTVSPHPHPPPSTSGLVENVRHRVALQAGRLILPGAERVPRSEEGTPWGIELIRK